jgi:26S proteasome regulatory subunit N5
MLTFHFNSATRELMQWPGIESLYGKFLRKTPVFSSDKRWEDLHTRVIEHVSIVYFLCNKINRPVSRTSVW